MTSTSPLGAVHLIADLDAFADGPGLVDAARPLLDAGLPSLQLRGKGRTTDELVAAGRALREAAARAGCRFVVNGCPEAAAALEADGLHLPEAAAAAVSRIPPGMPWGRSCHDADCVRAVGGAAWVFLSPVFPTRSKPGAAALGTAALARIVRGADVPVIALGGITEANVDEVLAAGGAGVAAIRGLRGAAGLRLLEAALASARRARPRA